MAAGVFRRVPRLAAPRPGRTCVPGLSGDRNRPVGRPAQGTRKGLALRLIEPPLLLSRRGYEE
ncbi:MAG: hypothetical protein COX57_04705 [Alphaproteobacteria bacterium CG_4_10_14_0_2_um_filter_63_37]|nr:MAG: hypothetical protein AUJ55_13225 [Proteobacteria bacterium CG1_02_64_396]PJA25199.1 MAG: hypothetical protein COX57_04705 [Alphaproteobacteria bacterium CG_4_10_14_0_2_um_filter_63_37]